jgi:hypothetical protein
MNLLFAIALFLAGAVTSVFVLRNNPKLAKKVGLVADVVDKVVDKIEDKIKN